MADEQYELRRVSWHELFSFTHIFKGFRMAIQPSKLALALMAVVLVALLGHGMDRAWSLAGRTAHVSDPFTHFQTRNREAFGAQRERRQRAADERLADLYRRSSQRPFYFSAFLGYYRTAGGATDRDSLFYEQFQRLADERAQEITAREVPADLAARIGDNRRQFWSAHVSTVDDMLAKSRELTDRAAQSARDVIGREGDPDRRQTLRERLDADVVAARRAQWMARVDLVEQPERAIFGQGIFATLWTHERQCFQNALRAVTRLDFFTGFSRLLSIRPAPPAAAAAQPPAVPEVLQLARAEELGMLPWVFMMLWGFVWLLTTHMLYGVIFLLITLAIWALFGGSIARMAAMHAAREEKISWRQATRFSIGKFLSFFSAPLIPLAIILVLGVLLGLGGMLGLLPVGDIVVGVIFVIALILGAVIAFLLVGLFAGGPLMYPTIAVEGSDSFDAISRSFSYVLGRPWRYALYSLVAVVYGAACYVFVRLFAFLLLRATHFFVSRGFFSLGMGSASRPELGVGADKTDLLWTAPSFYRLAGPVNWPAMNWHETVAAAFINLWVYLVAGLVLAFVLTFVVSAYTLIYYLLRRKVDATDLDDVYVEEGDEEDLPPPAPEDAEPMPPTTPPAEGAEPDTPPPAVDEPPQRPEGT